MKVNTEYRKGVLFVRLMGRMDENGYLNKVNDIIDDFGIRFVVLNLKELRDISLENIEHIIRYNEKILKKKIKLFICDSKQRRGRMFENIIPSISNELEAFSLI